MFDRIDYSQMLKVIPNLGEDKFGFECDRCEQWCVDQFGSNLVKEGEMHPHWYRARWTSNFYFVDPVHATAFKVRWG